MLKEVLIKLYERDLDKLKKEINLYQNEENLWIVKKEIPNSAGNLTLHLLGNLNHFFGEILDKNGYVRDRPSEFSKQNVPREDLSKQIDETIEVVKTALNNLSDDDFAESYPVKYNNETVTNAYMLTHLATHFNYHLGQINYHRRLIS